MKRIFIFTLAAIVLSACGQGEKNTQSKEDPSAEQPPPVEEFEVNIAAATDDEAAELIRRYVTEELDHEAYSGLYLAHEPSKHFVILIQELHSLQEVAAGLENFSKQNGSKSEGEYPVKLKPATYSYQTLENVMNQLNASHEELIVTERRVLSFGMNEMENRIDLYVSSREDLNEELINDITNGFEGIVRIEEGVMSLVDDNGLPTTEPYIVGEIMEKKKNQDENLVFLIEEQIYVSVNSATVIKDNEGNAIDEAQLSVGDKVSVWTDGGINDSLPASGYAVAIQLQ